MALPPRAVLGPATSLPGSARLPMNMLRFTTSVVLYSLMAVPWLASQRSNLQHIKGAKRCFQGLRTESAAPSEMIWAKLRVQGFGQSPLRPQH